jgi:hypothetical protein
MTAIPNTVLTAAQWNTHVRDNLNETAPAKATMASSHFVGVGPNEIAERMCASQNIGTNETTTSVNYTDLATIGPAVTTVTGNSAIIFLKAGLENTGISASSFMGFEVTGASSLAASDTSAINIAGTAQNTRFRMGSAYMLNSLTAGTNTFTAKYKVGAGTGSFNQRQLAVFPL